MNQLIVSALDDCDSLMGWSSEALKISKYINMYNKMHFQFDVTVQTDTRIKWDNSTGEFLNWNQTKTM